MDTNNIRKFTYSKSDFIYNTCWENKQGTTEFDRTIQNCWTMKLNDGCFRYKLNITRSKTVPGKYKLFAQLNVDRAVNRRVPQEVNSINQPFNPQHFNFTKMDKKEIIFELINEERNDNGSYLAINVSPIEFGNCLYLHKLNNCLPQIPTLESLCGAIEFILLSNTPSLRLGFNGLCAYCSLNHLHYHTLYLDMPMLLETVEVEHLSGPCYTLTAFPSKGFLFQFGRGQDLEEFARNVYKLVNFLQENESPYNIYVTRSALIGQKIDDGKRDYIRAYVFTRKSTFGIKDMTAFHPALCELFGHITVKTQESYDSLNEDSVSMILSDITTEPFNKVLQKVKSLFSQ